MTSISPVPSVAVASPLTDVSAAAPKAVKQAAEALAASPAATVDFSSAVLAKINGDHIDTL
jgi:hypothetical protein